MQKKFQIKIDGKTFDVEAESMCGNALNLRIDGKPYTVEIEESDSPLKSKPNIRVVNATPQVNANEPETSTVPAVIASASNDVIVAPMPGVIMDIAVKPGDSITARQPICALEAMKMKNIIHSHRDGIVACVEVTDGQHVPFGAVIIRFA